MEQQLVVGQHLTEQLIVIYGLCFRLFLRFIPPALAIASDVRSR